MCVSVISWNVKIGSMSVQLLYARSRNYQMKVNFSQFRSTLTNGRCIGWSNGSMSKKMAVSCNWMSNPVDSRLVEFFCSLWLLQKNYSMCYFPSIWKDNLKMFDTVLVKMMQKCSWYVVAQQCIVECLNETGKAFLCNIQTCVRLTNNSLY